MLLVPYPIRLAFKRYAFDLMGVDPHSVTDVSIGRADEDVNILTEDVVSSWETVARLQEITRGYPFTVLPYIHDRGVSLLQERLGIANGRAPFVREGGVEKLNSKAHFRRFAEEVGIPLAQGTVVSDPSALTQALARLLTVTGSVIVKQDFNAGGEGNRVVTRGALPQRTSSAPWKQSTSAGKQGSDRGRRCARCGLHHGRGPRNRRPSRR